MGMGMGMATGPSSDFGSAGLGSEKQVLSCTCSELARIARLNERLVDCMGFCAEIMAEYQRLMEVIESSPLSLLFAFDISFVDLLLDSIQIMYVCTDHSPLVIGFIEDIEYSKPTHYQDGLTHTLTPPPPPLRPKTKTTSRIPNNQQWQNVNPNPRFIFQHHFQPYLRTDPMGAGVIRVITHKPWA